MRALKTLVIGMGVLILIGIAVIGVTLYNRMTHADDAPVTAATEPAAHPAPAPTPGSLSLPAGSRIKGLAGGAQVVVHVELPGGQEQLIVLDPATGRVTHRLGVSDRPD